MTTTSPTPKLTERRFLALAKKLRTALTRADAAAADEKLAAYWEVGALILDEKISRAAGYHNSVLRDLSRETGITLRTLQRAVAFRESYEAPPENSGLSWSHFRVLLQLPTKRERDAFARETKKNSWSVKHLETAIAAALAGPDASSERGLPRPSDPSYLYAAKVEVLLDADTFDLLIDLGFHTWKRQRVRLAGIDAPELGTKEGRAARTFVAEKLAAARSLAVKTLKPDAHGRTLVHLFFAPTDLSLYDCFLAGTHLNALLVDENHATRAPSSA